MGIVADHKQKMADYKRLVELCGQVDDYCGAWCNNDVLNDMLENPTKKKAMHYYSTLIDRFFNTGVDIAFGGNRVSKINTCDPEVYEILKRNGNV